MPFQEGYVVCHRPLSWVVDEDELDDVCTEVKVEMVSRVVGAVVVVA